MRTTKHNKLTELSIKKAAPKAILSDGGGLYVRSRTYVFRYTSPVTARERDLSLGSISSVRLQTARKRAAEYRELIALGTDPHDHEDQAREAAKAKEAANITFGKVAERWMEERLPDRKSPKNQRAIRSIETHMKPLANAPIAAVNSAAIAAVVKPLENRLAQRDNTISLIHSIFDWAMAADIIPENLNPARRTKLNKLLPKSKSKDREVKHNRFVPLAELPGFMARLANTRQSCSLFRVHRPYGAAPERGGQYALGLGGPEGPHRNHSGQHDEGGRRAQGIPLASRSRHPRAPIASAARRPPCLPRRL
jgi:hypothetical protein